MATGEVTKWKKVAEDLSGKCQFILVLAVVPYPPQQGRIMFLGVDDPQKNIQHVTYHEFHFPTYLDQMSLV